MKRKIIYGFIALFLSSQFLHAEIEPETVSIAELPPPHSKTVYMVDPIFPHIVKTKFYVIDGRFGRIEGMLDAGLAANGIVSPDQSKFYVFNTFYSKLVRGERSDFLTVYDTKTLTATDDIPIPSKRMLAIPKMNAMGFSKNAEVLYYMNLTPATGVGFIDLKNKKHLGETNVPNCNMIYPHGETEFTMICSNGSLLTMNAKDLKNIKRSQTKSFFDVVNDPVFEHSAFDRKRNMVHFLSYDGLIHSVTLGSTPKIAKPWSILTDAETKEGWRPGGWQVADIHYETNRMFVIMHRGPKWTHKYPGEEIWVYDMNTKKKIQTIKTKIASYSIKLSQDERPFIFATTPEDGSMTIISATTGKTLKIMEGVGVTPHALLVGGGR